jgi:hypothetical protein
MEQKIKAYKAFDKDLSCRGFKYEVGKEYEETGDIKACEKGFHACPYPLDVFSYYTPAGSRFCEVEQSGKIDDSESDWMENEINKGNGYKVYVTYEEALEAGIQEALKLI